MRYDTLLLLGPTQLGYSLYGFLSIFPLSCPWCEVTVTQPSWKSLHTDTGGDGRPQVAVSSCVSMTPKIAYNLNLALKTGVGKSATWRQLFGSSSVMRCISPKYHENTLGIYVSTYMTYGVTWPLCWPVNMVYATFFLQVNEDKKYNNHSGQEMDVNQLKQM